jgi:hypothetical protein
MLAVVYTIVAIWNSKIKNSQNDIHFGEDLWNAYVRANASLLVLLYLPLTNIFLAYFDCTAHPSGVF